MNMTEEEKVSKIVYKGETFDKIPMPEGEHDIRYVRVIELTVGQGYENCELEKARVEATHYKRVMEGERQEFQFFRYSNHITT